MTLSPKLRTALTVGLMFLPAIGYSLGDWLIAHWAIAKQLDEALKPYAFNASLLIGLAIGLGQLGWRYWRTREVSSYTLQQLGLLLAYTLIPLRFGHFLPGNWNVLGLVGLGVAAVYLADALLGGALFVAFPKHFSPEVAERVNEPRVRRVIVHIEYGFVLTYTLQNLFLLFGNQLLPKAAYLALLPFYSKALWGAFMAFSFGYPRWLVKRRQAAAAVAPEALPAST